MAGSVIEIEPGGLRELHWHPNADEWQYYLSARARCGLPRQGEAVTEQFEAGDVGYAPMGAGHYILNTGPEVCRMLIGFNSGHYQAIDLSAWLATNPASMGRQPGLSEEILAKLPTEDRPDRRWIARRNAFSGGGGIQTHGPREPRSTAFKAAQRIQPLCHPSRDRHGGVRRDFTLARVRRGSRLGYLPRRSSP